jgi:predicted metal-dependent enzyme (double-stranded beta helix superfamily)
MDDAHKQREDIVAMPSATERVPLRCTAAGTALLARPLGAGQDPDLARFAARVNALAPHEHTPPAGRDRVLAAVEAIAARLDPTGCEGEETGYGRCVLHDDPAGWSLAAIALRPGQAIPPHDHAAWGGAVTVQGTERNRRFSADQPGGLALLDERDYPAGTGYVFDPVDVHEPVGADSAGVTVSLHFLVDPKHRRYQVRHERR